MSDDGDDDNSVNKKYNSRFLFIKLYIRTSTIMRLVTKPSYRVIDSHIGC